MSAKFVQITSTQSELPGPDHHVHDQPLPEAEWTIDHTLDKHPSATVVDSAGSVVYGSVLFVSTSQIIIEFSAPFSGKAYLN